MNSKYIYFLEYTRYRCCDRSNPYAGADFRPIFISLDENKVIDLFNKRLEESKNNYLMCISCFQNKIGLSIADVTTGDFYMTEVEGLQKLQDEIYKYVPTEIICNDAFMMSGFDVDDLRNRLGIAVYSLEPWYFDDDGCRKCLMNHFKVNTLAGLGIDDFPTGMISAGALMQYLLETQKTSLEHFTHITPYLASRFMLLDSSTRRNLELTETLREKQKRGSLL